METLTMQNGIQTFLDSLSSVQTDRFVRVMGRLESLGAQGEIELLEKQLHEVKAEIEAVNRGRDALRVEKQDIEETIKDLERLPESRGHQDLVQFRLLLLNLVADLDERIAAARPVNLHERKAAIKKAIANRCLLAELASMLRTTAANGHGN